MSPVFRGFVIAAVAAVLCAATFLLVPRLRAPDAGGAQDADILSGVDSEQENGEDAEESGKGGKTAVSRTVQIARDPSRPAADREKAKSDVGEMRNEVGEMVRKFRGTPEERQEVIDECESGRELIRLFAELSESSIEMMSPEELEEERESFEKEYRAQLDYLQTGQLERMLKTPEEREVIGSTIETVRDYLERIDDALRAAGY